MNSLVGHQKLRLQQLQQKLLVFLGQTWQKMNSLAGHQLQGWCQHVLEVVKQLMSLQQR
jgi:hypothetical protein